MEIRKFLCQKIGLPKGYLAMKYYLSATKTVATGGYFRDNSPILCILELLVISCCLQTLLRKKSKMYTEGSQIEVYMMFFAKFH